MAISKAQGRALFGKAAAWDLAFVTRPADSTEAALAWLVNPQACGAAGRMIKALKQEQRTKPTHPTQCLLCSKNFLLQLPACLAVMSPVTRQGPSAGFALCEACEAKPDMEERVQAYLHDKLGAQETRWGTA